MEATMVSSPAQNKNTVKSMYEAFGRGDIPYILSQFSNEIELDASGIATIPFARIYRGKSDATQYFVGLNEAFETTAFEVSTILSEGNRVAAFGRQAGKGRTSGKSFDAQWAMSWEFDDNGLAKKWKGYIDSARLDAAYKTN